MGSLNPSVVLKFSIYLQVLPWIKVDCRELGGSWRDKGQLLCKFEEDFCCFGFKISFFSSYYKTVGWIFCFVWKFSILHANLGYHPSCWFFLVNVAILELDQVYLVHMLSLMFLPLDVSYLVIKVLGVPLFKLLYNNSLPPTHMQKHLDIRW